MQPLFLPTVGLARTEPLFWAHNPKAAGSNPAPATLLKGLEALFSRPFHYTYNAYFKI